MRKIKLISDIFLNRKHSWEQRKLSDIVERVTRKNTNLESKLPLTISAQYGLVDQVTYFNNRVASQNISNYYLVKNGEFAYNKSSSDGYPFGAVKRLDLYDMGVLSTLYIVFSLKDLNVSSDFLACYYDTDKWHKQVSERAAEGARNHGLLNISAEDFLDTDLMIPQDIREQALIGDYFKSLDNLITLHQCESSHKNGLLQTLESSVSHNVLCHDLYATFVPLYSPLFCATQKAEPALTPLFLVLRMCLIATIL